MVSGLVLVCIILLYLVVSLSAILYHEHKTRMVWQEKLALIVRARQASLVNRAQV